MKTKLYFRAFFKENRYVYGIDSLTIILYTKPYLNSYHFNRLMEITFQRNNNQEDKRWYGLTYNIETSDVNIISKCLRIAKRISNNFVNIMYPDPYSIIRYLDAEELVIADGEMIPVSLNGYYKYKVLSDNGYYKDIYAIDADDAQKQLDAMNDNTYGKRYYFSESQSVLIEAKSDYDLHRYLQNQD